MAVEEFMKGVEESRETANARALASFSATGADGSVIAYGSKVALEQDPDVPFFVAGWAVVQGEPIAVAEPAGSVRIGLTDGIMLFEPSQLVRIEQHEAVEVEFDLSEAKLPSSAEDRDETARTAQEEALGYGVCPGTILKRDGRKLVVQAIATDESGPFAIMSDEDGEMVNVPLAMLAADAEPTGE